MNDCLTKRSAIQTSLKHSLFEMVVSPENSLGS